MVHKLDVKQLQDGWKNIMRQFRTVFPISETEESYLFQLALLDKVQVWFGYIGRDIDNPAFMAITAFTTPFASDERLLLIDYLLSRQEDKISVDVWEEGFNKIKDYAKQNNCTKIVSLIDNPYLYEVLSKIDTVKARVAMEVKV